MVDICASMTRYPLLLGTKTVTFHREVLGMDAAAWFVAGWDPDDTFVLVK